MDSPFGLLAELTYRCPLGCAYCSNPLNMEDYADELGTEEWRRVLAEAVDLGVLQCHFSGGEPLLRRDLPEIVAEAHDLGLYTNLITSGIGLDDHRRVASGIGEFDRVVGGGCVPGSVILIGGDPAE